MLEGYDNFGVNSHFKELFLSFVAGVKMQSEIVAGDRKDNQWLQYNSSSLPQTQRDWDGCVFVEKTHWGYYSWPRFSVCF